MHSAKQIVKPDALKMQVSIREENTDTEDLERGSLVKAEASSVVTLVFTEHSITSPCRQ
jgi:hypothetical protein